MHIIYAFSLWAIGVFAAVVLHDGNTLCWLVLMGACVVLSTVLAYHVEIRRQLELHPTAKKNYCLVTDPANDTITPMFYLSILLTVVIWALVGQVGLLSAAGVLLLSIFQYPLALNVIAVFQWLIGYLLLSVD